MRTKVDRLQAAKENTAMLKSTVAELVSNYHWWVNESTLVHSLVPAGTVFLMPVWSNRVVCFLQGTLSRSEWEAASKYLQ